MGIIIQPATPSERGDVIALWEDAGLTRPWNDPGSDFDKAVSNPTSSILVAYIDDVLVGAVMVGYDGHRGWLYYLATNMQNRGADVGRTLIAAAENRLSNHGCKRIRLMVRDDNVSARGFYNAIGYERQDVIVLGRTLD